MSAALWAALISSSSAEVIRSFTTDIVINEDSSLFVSEEIVYDFEGAQKHGIYRNVKDTHSQEASAWYKDRYIDLKLISVTRNGAPEPYLIQDYDGLSIRIGDANKTIAGQHTYKITYRVDGALAHYENGTTELYWNVTGDEWPARIEKVVAQVRAGGEARLLRAQYCYEGPYGEATACQATLATGEAQFAASGLSPGEQMTIAQAVSLPQPPVVLEKSDTVLLWLLGVVVWFTGLFIWIFRWRRAHKPEQTIVAQYEPYLDFKPMFTGVLFDNRLDPRDLTASIVYLAQQGFLSIKQTEERVLWIFGTTDYELTLLRSTQEAETELQREVLKMLFGDTKTPGETMKLSDITKSTSRQRTNHMLMQAMKKASVKDLVARGFLEQKLSRTAKPILVFICIWAFPFFGAPIVAITNLPIMFWVLVVLSVILTLLFATERRTAQGYEALNHLKGFKHFLSITEKERYKFHNAPSKSPEQFMEYLPYAIAFGVEKEWAEAFKDIAIDSPDWYSSPSGTYFNASSFTTDISSFATAFASSGASGSSGSGSGGGGFSGGGGGGGGGGSW